LSTVVLPPRSGPSEPPYAKCWKQVARLTLSMMASTMALGT